MRARSWMWHRRRPEASVSSACSPRDGIACWIADHAGRRQSARKAPKPGPEQTRRKALGPKKVVFGVDVMRISTPRKHENGTRRTAQSRGPSGLGPSGLGARSGEGLWAGGADRRCYFRSRLDVRDGPSARLARLHFGEGVPRCMGADLRGVGRWAHSG